MKTNDKEIKITTNYELAKCLKDAGFPQDKNGLGYWYTEKTIIKRFDKKIPCHKCYVPTLEELIDACGARFRCLRWIMNEKEWASFAFDNTRDCSDIIGKGKTKTEAVVKLWLELNKKQNE